MIFIASLLIRDIKAASWQDECQGIRNKRLCGDQENGG